MRHPLVRSLLAEIDRTMAGNGSLARRDCREEEVIGEPDALALLEDGDAHWRQLDRLLETGRRIKHDHASTVAAVHIRDKTWVIKRYNHRGTVHSLRQRLGGVRGRRALRRGLLLRELGIATPRPLFCVVRRRRGLPWNSYIVTECSAGEPICDLFDRGQLGPAQWERVSASTRKLVSRLHGFAITHGDVKTPNILWDGQHLEIIDLDALRIHRCRALFERFRAKDERTLAQRVAAYPDRNGVK